MTRKMTVRCIRGHLLAGAVLVFATLAVSSQAAAETAPVIVSVPEEITVTVCSDVLCTQPAPDISFGTATPPATRSDQQVLIKVVTNNPAGYDLLASAEEDFILPGGAGASMQLALRGAQRPFPSNDHAFTEPFDALFGDLASGPIAVGSRSAGISPPDAPGNIWGFGVQLSVPWAAAGHWTGGSITFAALTHPLPAP